MPSHIVRVLCEARSQSRTVRDSATGETPFAWRGSDLTFQLGLTDNGQHLLAAAVGQIILEVKALDATSADDCLMRKVFEAADCDDTFTAADWPGGSKHLLAAAFTKAEAALPPNSYRFIVRHIAPDDSEMTYISAEFRLLDPQSGSEGLDAPPVAWSYLDGLPVIRPDVVQTLTSGEKQQARQNIGIDATSFALSFLAGSTDAAASRALLDLGAGLSAHVAAVVISKSGARTQYVASANTDAARGVALTSAIQALTTGQTLICAPGDFYMAQTNLLLVDSCTYIWNGARLYINGSSASSRVGRETVLDIALFTSGFATAPTAVSNWKFVGPLTLDGGNVGNRNGLWPIGTAGAFVDGVTFKNWGTAASGRGFYSYGSVNKGNRMANCFFDQCAGTGAEFNSEYWVVSNCHAYQCGYGFVESGGNTAFANCSATFCTYGLRIMNTSNPGHGSWVGGNVNHSTTGIYTDPSITAAFGGFNFTGTIAHSTAFDLNGKGISWIGGEIGNTTFASTGTNAGVSQFHNVRCLSTSSSESTSLAGLSSSERANLKFYNCRDELGALVTWNDGVDFAYVAKTGNYTLTGADYTVEVTANSPTITLPTAVNCAGRAYILINTGAGTVTTATTSSQTVDGTTPATLAAGGRRHYVSNGANWLTW